MSALQNQNKPETAPQNQPVSDEKTPTAARGEDKAEEKTEAGKSRAAGGAARKASTGKSKSAGSKQTNINPARPAKAKSDKAKSPPKQANQQPASGTKPQTYRRGSKAAIILSKLQTAKGATIEELATAASWQKHSVRGFLSGSVKRKLGLEVVSETGKDGIRRYRIADSKPAS